MKGTNIVTKFLETKFYNNKNYFSNYRLINDKTLQIKGIDCEAFLLNNFDVILIDEKCALSYNNINDLKTYSLELSFKNKKGDIINGWFLDSSKVTSHYLFCWLDKANKNNKDLVLEDIYRVEIMLVSKESILKYLNDKFYLTPEILFVLCNGMRSLNKRKLVLDSNISFVYSSYLKEKPINLILNKEILRELSILNVLINNT